VAISLVAGSAMTSANLSVLKSELGTTAYMHLSVVMAHMQSYHLNVAGEWLLRMFQDSGQSMDSPSSRSITPIATRMYLHPGYLSYNSMG